MKEKTIKCWSIFVPFILIKTLVIANFFCSSTVFATYKNSGSQFVEIEQIAKNFGLLKNLIDSVLIVEQSDTLLSGKHALFLPFQNTILLNETLKNETQIQQLSVLSHELGHALAYQKFTPTEVAILAARFGPWKKANQQEFEQLKKLGFSSPFMKEKHYLHNATVAQLPASAPSRYALQNRMEWFAECFASWAIQKNLSENTKKPSTLNSKRIQPLKNISEQFTKHLENKLF